MKTKRKASQRSIVAISLVLSGLMMLSLASVSLASSNALSVTTPTAAPADETLTGNLNFSAPPYAGCGEERAEVRAARQALRAAIRAYRQAKRAGLDADAAQDALHEAQDIYKAARKALAECRDGRGDSVGSRDSVRNRDSVSRSDRDSKRGQKQQARRT